MPWKDWLVPLDLSDPRNADREDPRGERVRVRLNTERGRVVDFLVQYESPIDDEGTEHLPVIRFDGSHGHAHFHVLRPDGSEIRRVALPEHVNYGETVRRAVATIQRDWQRLQSGFFREG